MLTRVASKIAFVKGSTRNFAAIWPTIKGSKVVNSLEDVHFFMYPRLLKESRTEAWLWLVGMENLERL